MGAMSGSNTPSSPPTPVRGLREIRINPIVPSESVLVATARSMRPKKTEERIARDHRQRVDDCPFCVGNEAMTPPEIASYPAPSPAAAAGPWAVRIVENLYPVVGDDREDSNYRFGLQQAIDGYGRHEVIIDHPQHGIAVHEMDESHLALLFKAYRRRMDELYRSNRRLRYVLVFKNFGPAAGASIAHTHSQLIALPIIPDNVQAEVVQSRAYYEKHHRCIFCTLIDEALTFEATIYDRETGEIKRKIHVGQYVVERGRRFIAIKPFASRYEWEVHILPLDHQADFLALAEDDAADLARVMRRTMARLDAVLGGVQYNYFLHSLPHDITGEACEASYHWHLEITPRTSIPTGFELGSGLYVNTVAPEDAAERLRAVVLD
jgi:UDPglucose--hexose-1-phosphate uridylyltransferase